MSANPDRKWCLFSANSMCIFKENFSIKPRQCSFLHEKCRIEMPRKRQEEIIGCESCKFVFSLSVFHVVLLKRKLLRFYGTSLCCTAIATYVVLKHRSYVKRNKSWKVTTPFVSAGEGSSQNVLHSSLYILYSSRHVQN